MDSSKSRMMQAMHGCSVCRYAGNNAHGNAISPGLTSPQLVDLQGSGKDYYCTYFKRPVYSNEGKSCSSFYPDH